MSFGVALLSCHGDASAVHEDDFPGLPLLLEEGRFQPILVYGTGGVCDAALIDVSNPRQLADDVDVGFSHVPFVTLASEVLGFDEGHDGVSVESRASIENIEVRRNDGVEFRKIVCKSCCEYRAHCIYDLSFAGTDEFPLGSPSDGINRKHSR